MNIFRTQKAMIIALALAGCVTLTGLGYTASLTTEPAPKAAVTPVVPTQTYWQKKLRSFLPWAGGTAVAAAALALRWNQTATPTLRWNQTATPTLRWNQTATPTLKISILHSSLRRGIINRSFNMRSNATIRDLKERIRQELDFDVNCQQLILDGKRLHNDTSLQSYSERLDLTKPIYLFYFGK